MTEEATTLYCGDNCNHTGPCRRRPAGVAEIIGLWHQHVWVYDGYDVFMGFIYHCDAHDPPVVRQVPSYAIPPYETITLSPPQNGTI